MWFAIKIHRRLVILTKGIDDLINICYRGIQDFRHSERFKEYLLMLTKFHKYSVQNANLIYLQKPNSTFVAGYTTWKSKFSRTVKKGEKGIKILAPIMKKIENNSDTDEEEHVVVGYRIVSVFDVSQTEGKPLPKLNELLTGSVPQYDKLFEVLIKLTDYHVSFSDNLGSPNGLCCFNTKEIILKANMSQEQTIKTLIHEITHAIMHYNSSLDRSAKEIQAESVAFILCNVLDIDSSEYSFPYIATWGGLYDDKLFFALMEDVKITSQKIIKKLEKSFKMS